MIQGLWSAAIGVNYWQIECGVKINNSLWLTCDIQNDSKCGRLHNWFPPLNMVSCNPVWDVPEMAWHRNKNKLASHRQRGAHLLPDATACLEIFMTGERRGENQGFYTWWVLDGFSGGSCVFKYEPAVSRKTSTDTIKSTLDCWLCSHDEIQLGPVHVQQCDWIGLD